MPWFFYRAADEDGVVFQSKIEFETREQVAAYLQENKLTMIETRELGYWERDLSDVWTFRVPKKELVFFCRKLYFILLSGAPFQQGLERLASQTKDKKWKTTLLNINAGILSGEGIWGSFEKSGAFPIFFVSMTRAGEESNELAVIMDKLATHYEKEYSLEEQLKGALLYPCLVGVMMLVVIMVALLHVVPSYADIFSGMGADLPMITQLMIGISNFFVRYFWLISMVGVLIGGALFGFLRTKTGRYFGDALKLKIPWVKDVYLQLASFRFCQTLSLLMESKVEILVALDIVKHVLNNRVLDSYMDHIVVEVQRGTSLGQLLMELQIFDSMFVSMVQVGEETNSLVESLRGCSVFLQKETDWMVAKVNRWIEPVITIVLGIILGLVMMAIMLPSFYMVNII